MRRSRARLPVHEPGSEGRLDYAEGGYSQAPVTGGGGGTTLARSTVVITCSAATGTVDLGTDFRIDGETASAEGRFRLYRSTSGQGADSTRAIGVAAPTAVGLLLEDIFTAGALTITAVPAPGAPESTLCAWSWSGALGSTVTLTMLKFL